MNLFNREFIIGTILTLGSFKSDLSFASFYYIKLIILFIGIYYIFLGIKKIYKYKEIEKDFYEVLGSIVDIKNTYHSTKIIYIEFIDHFGSKISFSEEKNINIFDYPKDFGSENIKSENKGSYCFINYILSRNPKIKVIYSKNNSNKAAIYKNFKIILEKKKNNIVNENNVLNENNIEKKELNLFSFKLILGITLILSFFLFDFDLSGVNNYSNSKSDIVSYFLFDFRLSSLINFLNNNVKIIILLIGFIFMLIGINDIYTYNSGIKKSIFDKKNKLFYLIFYKLIFIIVFIYSLYIFLNYSTGFVGKNTNLEDWFYFYNIIFYGVPIFLIIIIILIIFMIIDIYNYFKIK